MPLTTLRILHLEDLSTDAELIARTLRKGGLEFTVWLVSQKNDYVKALKTFKPHIVLSDHSLASFDSAEALEILHAESLDIPFILVSATVSEDFAVDIMKRGASDYVLKDRLQRLPAAVENAIRKKQAEQERNRYLHSIIESEQLLRRSEHLAQLGTFVIDLGTKSVKWSDGMLGILNITGEERPTLEQFLFMQSENDREKVLAYIFSKDPDSNHPPLDIILTFPNSQRKYLRFACHKIKDEGGTHQLTHCIAQDVTSHVTAKFQAESAAHNLVSDLQTRNRELQQFSFMVSHNLRAPIARILGLAGIYVQDDDPDAQWLERIVDEARQLDRVVRDMNNIISAREADKKAKEKVDLAEQMDLILQVLHPEIQDAHAEINVDFSICPSIYTARGHLYSILFNLVSNAIKYRKPGEPAHIRIHSQSDEYFAYVSVRDSGIGIDLEQYGTKLFMLYSRLHIGHAPGRGVGLNLIKAEATALGGDVTVQSEVGIGSTFTLALPLAKV